MVSFLIGLVLLSYRNPRAAMRQVLDRVRGWEGAALLFGLSFALTSAVSSLVSLLAGHGAAGLSLVFGSLIYSAAAYAIAVLLIWAVGRGFGGRGSAAEIGVMVAWHSLATVIFAPIVALTTLSGVVQEMTGILILAQFVMVGLVIWLLAGFIAEAHGFRSAARVAGGILATVMMIGLLFSAFLPGLATG